MVNTIDQMHNAGSAWSEIIAQLTNVQTAINSAASAPAVDQSSTEREDETESLSAPAQNHAKTDESHLSDLDSASADDEITGGDEVNHDESEVDQDDFVSAMSPALDDSVRSDDEELDPEELSQSIDPMVLDEEVTDASESELQDDDTEPMQPIGEDWLIICRVSSDKGGEARRVREGIQIGERLRDNCREPDIVRSVNLSSMQVQRRSSDPSSFEKVKPNKLVKKLKPWFLARRGKTVTVIFRGVDGFTTNEETMLDFCLWLKKYRIKAQLIFTWNKVCEEIRPSTLRPCKGVGGTADFMASDILAHLKKKRKDDEFERILQIWALLNANKAKAQGLQDRNELPDKDFPCAEEVSSIRSSFGRKGQPLKAKTHPSANKSGRIKKKT